MADTITFQTTWPNAQPGEYGSSDDPTPYVRLANPQESLENMSMADEIVIDKPSIEVMFNYPLEHEHILTIFPPDGESNFTRAGLAKAISLKYQEIYQEENESTAIIPESCAERSLREEGGGGILLLNRVTTNGKWGIWGHVLEDLDLHSVWYDEEAGYYSLGIDS